MHLESGCVHDKLLISERNYVQQTVQPICAISSSGFDNILEY